jgi:hypothetical protein
MRRLLTRLVLVVAAGCAAFLTFLLFQRLPFLLEQRGLLLYRAPADRIIVAEGTEDVARLSKTAGYQKFRPCAEERPGPTRAVAYYLPGSTRLLWFGSGPYAFLHRRRAPGQAERLVSVEVQQYDPEPPSGQHYELFALAQIPAFSLPDNENFSGRGARISNVLPEDGGGGLTLDAGGNFRLYAGQPDPADDSHFTIRYELNGKSDIIDGWLMSDETVNLQVRGGGTPK